MILTNRPRIQRWVPPLLLMLLATPAWTESPAVLHHQLDITLKPDEGRLFVADRISLPDGARARYLEVVLNAGLQIVATNAKAVSPYGIAEGNRRRYRFTLDPLADTLSISYEGTPQAPRRSAPQAMPGVVLDSASVYLDGAGAWYPLTGEHPVTAELTVHHPPGWQSISQGARLEGTTTTTRWRSEEPQEEIYLLAAPYRFYSKPGPHAEAQVFLRTSDDPLAQRFLDITDRYLDLYSRLIGPYPYPKFAVVENRWETGYGMPSFTLLGSRVMRLPFILTSSYPHEILHNWWGNGVYPDYASGNWSEGLTSYLADHLIQEQQGRSADYRRSILQKYADYVASESDFPLREFRARHDGASQAVGYGKTLMFFHMLRRNLGDTAFRTGLRRLYRDYRYRSAGFEEIRRVFEAVSGRPLAAMFHQWVARVGAPVIALGEPQVRDLQQKGFRLEGELRQSHAGTPYRLRVPVAVTVADSDTAAWSIVELDSASTRFAITLPSRPLRIDIDPRFDLFRRLAPEELPPSLGQVFGAANLTVVVPSGASAEERDAYLLLVAQWRRQFPGIRTQEDILPLPENGGIWVLGKTNRHAASQLKRISAQFPVELGPKLKLGEEVLTEKDLSLVLTLRRSAVSTLAYLQVGSVAAVPGLARKLPHYGKYSYLAFAGDDAVNVTKGQWPVHASPLTLQLTDEKHERGKLPAEAPLIE